MRAANINDIYKRPILGPIINWWATKYGDWNTDDSVDSQALAYKTSNGEKVTIAAGAVADAYKTAQGSIVRFMASSDSPFLPELNVIDSCLNSNPIWEKIKPQIYKK